MPALPALPALSPHALLSRYSSRAGRPELHRAELRRRVRSALGIGHGVVGRSLVRVAALANERESVSVSSI